jgi:Flp pilus assembly protein TadG
MVEFALILPVLLIIVLGIINFGFLFGQKLSLNQAVREGARLAVVPGVDVANPGDDVDTLTEIQDAVRSSLGGLVPSGDVDVTALKSVNPDVNATTGCKEIPVGESLWVRAEYPASLLVPLPVPGLPNTFNLTSESVFRCEWSG